MEFPNYSPLPSSDSVELDSASNPLAHQSSDRRPPASFHKVIEVNSTVFYIGLCTIVSIAINLLLWTTLAPWSQASTVALHDLDSPSQYIGLDRVVRHANKTAPHKPLQRINYPEVLAQISARSSTRVSPHIIKRTSNFTVSNTVRNLDHRLWPCC